MKLFRPILVASVLAATIAAATTSHAATPPPAETSARAKGVRFGPAPAALEALSKQPNASAIRIAQLRALGEAVEGEVGVDNGRHIVTCYAIAYGPSLGSVGVYGLGETRCPQVMELVQNRVCIEVYNQNTGAIALDSGTCKPSSGYTGCAGCASHSKVSYQTSYCYGHFSYRTVNHSHISHDGVSGFITDRSLFVDMC